MVSVGDSIFQLGGSAVSVGDLIFQLAGSEVMAKNLG